MEAPGASPVTFSMSRAASPACPSDGLAPPSTFISVGAAELMPKQLL